jgi:hypothetical protein
MRSHTNIAWGELFAPLAAAIRYGAELQNQSVLFVLDNAADVNIINRRATRSSDLAQLLRQLTEVSMRFNFSFRAVHRPGWDNTLPDWLSRPTKHQFRLSPAAAKLHAEHAASEPRLTSTHAAAHNPYGRISSLAPIDPKLTPLRIPTCVFLTSSGSALSNRITWNPSSGP